MNKTLDYFIMNLDRARNLGVVFSAISKQTTGAIDLSDLLRAELVLSVSAFDYFIHEVVRSGVLEAFEGKRPKSPAYLRFEVPLSSVHLASSKDGSIDWLDEIVRLKHSWRSFQHADKVGEALRLVITGNPWQRISNELQMPADSAKRQLNAIVDRRNQIAHEADADPTVPGARWPISLSLASGATDYLEKLARSIHTVL